MIEEWQIGHERHILAESSFVRRAIQTWIRFLWHCLNSLISRFWTDSTCSPPDSRGRPVDFEPVGLVLANLSVFTPTSTVSEPSIAPCKTKQSGVNVASHVLRRAIRSRIGK